MTERMIKRILTERGYEPMSDVAVQSILVQFHDGTVKYMKFAYPITAGKLADGLHELANTVSGA